MKLFPPSLSSHSAACAMTIAIAIGLLFSPPVTNLAEFLLVVVVMSSAELRQRLWATWRQPIVKMALFFYVVIAIGVLYSIAPTSVALTILNGWRKLLLLPVALSLFPEIQWKRRFLEIFVGVLCLCAVVSFGMWLMNISLSAFPTEPGVYLRNHATQGMMFAVGAFAALFLALDSQTVQMRRNFFIVATVLVANIVVVTPGRSGYMVLLVCTAMAILGYFFSGQNRRGFKGAFIVLLLGFGILAALVLSPKSRERIELATYEVQHYAQSTKPTDMGIRVIFWKNTVELIRDNPLIGYGTGAFKEAYGRKVAGQEGVAGTESSDPHNQFMKIATEHGLIGLGIFLALIVTALRQPCSQPWRLLGAGVLVAWCATSLFNSHFSTFSEGTFIYVWLGVMLARSDNDSDSPTKALNENQSSS
jgi:O-antigen ligase